MVELSVFHSSAIALLYNSAFHVRGKTLGNNKRPCHSNSMHVTGYFIRVIISQSKNNKEFQYSSKGTKCHHFCAILQVKKSELKFTQPVTKEKTEDSSILMA